MTRSYAFKRRCMVTQRPGLWDKHLRGILEGLGWVSLDSHPGFWTHKKTGALLAVYVDDLLMAAPAAEEGRLWRELEARVKFGEPAENIGKFLGGHHKIVTHGDLVTFECHMKEFVEDAAEKYKNWGKWGADDEIGTLNYTSPEDIVAACQSPQTVTNLAGQTTLLEALDLLSISHAVVSNDSGLMHVAAATQRPVIGIFGSSSEAHTPPLGETAAAVSRTLACRPCFARDCPLGHTDCLDSLSPHEVIERLEQLLAKSPSQ